jgi:hypothetical protein
VSGTPQKKRLEALLEAHGAITSPVSALAAWSAFKEYGREVFGPENVGLLFQVGTYDFTGIPLFYFDPVCQFGFSDADGEHDHFEQLHCELTCPSIGALNGMEATLWSFDYPTADAFFDAVEALPAFQTAVLQSNYTAAVSHERV